MERLRVVTSRIESQLGGNISGTVYTFNDGSVSFVNDESQYWAESEDDLWEDNFQDIIPQQYLNAMGSRKNG